MSRAPSLPRIDPRASLLRPRRPRSTGRGAGSLLGGALLILACLAGGLLWFARDVDTQAPEDQSSTDAIVVLTGGSNRLQEGLRLLADGKGQKLFVSGVYRGVEVGELLRVAAADPAQSACCIVLGHEAADTVGNAEETARWMQTEGYGSLRLVTAGYHMRRALLEFRMALPEATVVPHPVEPTAIDTHAWWRKRETAVLVIDEYGKYLVALLRYGVWRTTHAVGGAA